ncbi:MAG: hypothetical protein AAFY54_04640 [Cyanobacteria bacterium J06648_10]
MTENFSLSLKSYKLQYDDPGPPPVSATFEFRLSAASQPFMYVISCIERMRPEAEDQLNEVQKAKLKSIDTECRRILLCLLQKRERIADACDSPFNLPIMIWPTALAQLDLILLEMVEQLRDSIPEIANQYPSSWQHWLLLLAETRQESFQKIHNPIKGGKSGILKSLRAERRALKEYQNPYSQTVAPARFNLIATAIWFMRSNSEQIAIHKAQQHFRKFVWNKYLDALDELIRLVSEGLEVFSVQGNKIITPINGRRTKKVYPFREQFKSGRGRKPKGKSK